MPSKSIGNNDSPIVGITNSVLKINKMKENRDAYLNAIFKTFRAPNFSING